MLDELQGWWQNATPQMQSAVQAGAVMLTAFLGGHFLAVIVGRTLRRHNFDAALRLPGRTTSTEADGGLTPTQAARHLVRLTLWAWAVWWLARLYGRGDIADKVAVIVGRVWALATLLATAMSLGGLLAQRLIDCLDGAPRGRPEMPSAPGTTMVRDRVAGLVGAGAYIFVLLLALLFAADVFDWPLTRSSALALWQFAQHLLIAVAALMIGCLGARWARDLTTEATTSPEKRAGQYTAMGIIAATTVLAVAVLLSGAGVLIGLASMFTLGYALFLVRGYLPDIAAGLQLRANQVREVWFDGAAWEVVEVGFVTTQVSRSGAFCRVHNRRVLDARLRGAAAEQGSVLDRSRPRMPHGATSSN